MFFHKDLLLQYFVAGTKVEGEDFELSLGDTEFGPTAPQLDPQQKIRYRSSPTRKKKD